MTVLSLQSSLLACCQSNNHTSFEHSTVPDYERTYHQTFSPNRLSVRYTSRPPGFGENFSIRPAGRLKIFHQKPCIFSPRPYLPPETSKVKPPTRHKKKVNVIVSSKGEDRREIFEEAAGISRYRYRKIDAERKLKSTEDNLLRLRDIVTELEERVGPLEKQSEKAQKFLEYSEEKRGLEIALWLLTLDRSQNELKVQDEKISIAKSQYDDAETALEQIQTESEEIYIRNGEYSSKIENIRTEITDIESQISEKRSLVSVAENDILHNNENIDR